MKSREDETSSNESFGLMNDCECFGRKKKKSKVNGITDDGK